MKINYLKKKQYDIIFWFALNNFIYGIYRYEIL